MLDCCWRLDATARPNCWAWEHRVLMALSWILRWWSSTARYKLIQAMEKTCAFKDFTRLEVGRSVRVTTSDRGPWPCHPRRWKGWIICMWWWTGVVDENGSTCKSLFLWVPIWYYYFLSIPLCSFHLFLPVLIYSYLFVLFCLLFAVPSYSYILTCTQRQEETRRDEKRR